MNVMLEEGAKMPTKGTYHSAGYDLHASKACIIPAKTHKRVNTGVHVQIDEQTAGVISHRSGHNHKHGLIAYGVVDPDYIGEIMVEVFNMGDKTYLIKEGERIAQIVFVPCKSPIFREVNELRPTTRGERGYGSTGNS